MIGCASVVLAALVGRGWPPVAALPLVLAAGTLFGTGMGALVWRFDLPPFMVTLAGMFFARGVGLVISMESIPIAHPFFTAVANLRIPLEGGASLPPTAVVFLAVFALGLYLSTMTPFGRYAYAVGGSKSSAILMGLPCGRTVVGVYAFSGFCSALAGIVYAIYTLSGNATAGTSLELDAIAAAVIGGTLLSGGVGHVAGTLLGVLILGTIQTILVFQGTFSSWWTRIAIGALLLAFILLQRLLQGRNRRE